MRIHSEGRYVVHLEVFGAYQRSFTCVKIIRSVQNDTVSCRLTTHRQSDGEKKRERF